MYANKAHVYQDWIQQYDANKNLLRSPAIYGNSVLQVDTCDNFIKTWSQLYETVLQAAGWLKFARLLPFIGLLAYSRCVES